MRLAAEQIQAAVCGMLIMFITIVSNPSQAGPYCGMLTICSTGTMAVWPAAVSTGIHAYTQLFEHAAFVCSHACVGS